LITDSVAMLLPAPGLFSMMNCWPSRSDNRWLIRRAMISVAPPGGYPTTQRTDRVRIILRSRASDRSQSRKPDRDHENRGAT